MKILVHLACLPFIILVFILSTIRIGVLFLEVVINQYSYKVLSSAIKRYGLLEWVGAVTWYVDTFINGIQTSLQRKR